MQRCLTNVVYKCLLPVGLLNFTHHFQSLQSAQLTYVRYTNMADLTYRSDVSSKIRNRLRLLRHDLFRPKFVLEESSVTPDYQKIHGIEQHPNLIWEEGGEPESSLSFATPLDNTVVDKAFEDAYEEEEKSDWPVHDLIDGRFFPAHQLSTALLNYMFHISYYVPTVPWKGMR